MKTPEEVIKELTESIERERKIIHDMYRSTIDGLRKTVKNLEAQQEELRTRCAQATSTVIDVTKKMGDAAREERQKHEQEVKALQTELARQTVGGMNIDYEIKVTNLQNENTALKKGFAELKAKLNVLEDRMSVPPNHKATEIRCECEECQNKRFKEQFEKALSD